MNEISPIERRRMPNDDRRAAIAKAARELIVEKGVEGLRTRDIAERVGINVATLHYHVPTKEALIELVAESLQEQFRDQHLTRPRRHLGTRERMALEFVDFREVALDRPEAMMVFSELMERARRDERIGAAILPLKLKWREIAREAPQGRGRGRCIPARYRRRGRSIHDPIIVDRVLPHPTQGPRNIRTARC